MRALAIAACIGLAACASPVAPDLSFRVLGQAVFPQATDLRGADPAVFVIRDAGAWADFLERSRLAPPSGKPEDPIPSIDWSTEMAIVLVLGARPTSGYGVRVNSIGQRSATVLVSATEVVSCNTVLQVVTYPLTAIGVTRTDRNIAVEWSRETCQ